MRRLATVAAALAALAALAAAAASAATARGTEGPATVLAAASLTEVLPQVDDTARASFGGSNQLAQQARQGFPFDVFLSASPQHTQALFAEGLVRKPVAFATNSLVLIVPRRNPARIATVGDLAKRSRLRLVVAGPKVPIGLYTREVLKRLGLLRVLRKTVSLEPDVKGIVGKVALGEADAGFVYATDVRPVASKRPRDQVPAESTADRDLRSRRRGAASRPGGGPGVPDRVARRGRTARAAPRRLRVAGLSRAFGVVLWAATALALAFLVVPVVAIFLRVPPGDLLDALGSPVARDALRVTLATTLVAQGGDPPRRDARRVPPRDAALPRPEPRRHARGAAARAPTRRCRHRPPRRVRAVRAAG